MKRNKILPEVNERHQLSIIYAINHYSFKIILILSNRMHNNLHKYKSQKIK